MVVHHPCGNTSVVGVQAGLGGAMIDQSVKVQKIKICLTNTIGQMTVVTVAAVLVLGYLTAKSVHFADIWFTKDQQGQLLYNNRKFPEAAERFLDPMWKGTAAYASGLYPESADTFGRIPTAEGFFNRGNALMKGREYRKAIEAYEQAVKENPDWKEASENLELSKYVLEYIEETREQSDTGDTTELSADGVVFDNDENKGKEMIITQQETGLEVQSAEKWMRTVNTESRDFLRTRFALENARGGQ